MNTIHFFQPIAATPRKATTPAPAVAPAVAPPVARQAYRERDFGVGYGTSSGYASHRRYSSNWAPPRFNFA